MVELDYHFLELVAKELYVKALKHLPPDVKDALERAYKRETNDTAKEIFKTILKQS